MSRYNKFENWLYIKAIPSASKFIEYFLMAALGYGIVMAVYNVIN